MDGYTGKRAVDELVIRSKGSGLILKDHGNNRERNAQFCNRIGCSGRLNSTKGIPNGCSEKAKSSKPSYRPSSSGKEIIGSSSRVYTAVSNNRKSSKNLQKKPSFQLETDSCETISVHDEPEVSELVSPPGKIQRGLQPESEDADSREVTVMEVGSSSVASNTRQRRNFIQRSGSGNQDTRASPSVTLASRSASQATYANTSRQTRNWPPNRDSGVASSVRTRRSNSSYGRGRLSNQANGNSLTLNECPEVIPQVPQSDIPIDLNGPVSTETASMLSSSYGRPGSISESLLSIMPSSPSEVGINRSAVNRGSFRRYNMDGIAEVLLALERIEQDEELTYEQLLVLETSLFLNGLNFYDQHRDMRLDIDDMSYEELLALEERMGTVSTALSEEAMSKCLKKSIYEATSSEDANVSCDGEKDDVKCSICQEEYVTGDELGRLQCEHRYHVACAQQWLRVKNWCPICKASAEPTVRASEEVWDCIKLE
ncbi:probable E3 ubiquitin-protein ligase HIP1 isoform X3 [Durio zibethinus]|uniref:RING-type E3 ubiquitin transferase n=1 Tax=Durio zibethinus TaxID=66656 RepID=A0A6P5XSK0_DURZI|nr:probable E3 ubiquitin-protein ligase HIP1 isoform X3 [Durio zibethinus]